MSKIISAIHGFALTQPDKTALTNGCDTFAYGDLPNLIGQRVKMLRDSGSRIVGLQMDNGPGWVLWDLAMIDSGVICIPIPPFFTMEQVDHVKNSVGMDHIITASGLTAINTIAVSNIPAGTAKITFTSGTTGTPKGVCLPQDRLETLVESLIDVIGKEYAQQHFTVLPLSILLENVAGIWSTLMSGATCHIYSLGDAGFANPFAPDFARFASVLQATRATSIILVPELLRGLMALIVREKVQLPYLEFVAVGGARVAPELVAQARWLDLPVYEGYGLSECGSVVSLNTPSCNRPGTAGRILPHVDIVIEQGEIIVRNPAFLGYVGVPHEGAFRTGDIGEMNDDFMAISGRSKNIIITSFGRNISPEWIESILLSQPEIAQAFVYGDGLASPAALIVPAREEIELSRAISRVNEALPAYAQITNYRMVPPMTAQSGMLTPSGRLRRDIIKQHYTHLMTEENDNGLLRSTR